LARQVDIRPATLADVSLIDAREQDRQELWASFHHTPEQAMQYGLQHGKAWIGFIEDEAAGIVGVVPQGRAGAIWAVFTPLAEKRPKAFLRTCKAQLEAIQGDFDILMNYADARNVKVLAWLKWLGFTVYPSELFGVDQLPFHRFEWRRLV
jgi:hypothetical protein